MVTIDLCGNLMFFIVVLSLVRVLCAQYVCILWAHWKSKYKYLHAMYVQKRYAKFYPVFVCVCIYVCKLWPHFVYFIRIFANDYVCVYLCAFFFIFVLMVVVFSIRLWPIAKFVFWNWHCGAYCVTCDSNQNGAEQNKTYSKRCSHTKLNQRNTHTHTLYMAEAHAVHYFPISPFFYSFI